MSAGIDDLLAQMGRDAAILNGWDAVLNISLDLANQLVQAQYQLAAQDGWKRIAIGFCQTFPNPAGGGKLAVYTRAEFVLERPALHFLGNNQAFVELAFKASGRTGTAARPAPAGFDPSRDGNPDDPTLTWDDTPFSALDFTATVPLSTVAGSSPADGDETSFVLDFPAGSFISPLFEQVRDPDELRLQLKNYLETHAVRYIVASIRTSLLDQAPQMAPKAFRIALLTTNAGNNVFQVFIATAQPVQSSLTIGVNEPIPDGYQLSAMFNHRIGGDLHPSLMAQLWLFLGTNLIFPGRSTLHLGPAFTPCDAVVLGTLEIDTSPSPSPEPPKRETAMLNIQETRQINVPGQAAFTAYGDDADKNAWYIPPNVGWARDSSGLPLFSLVKYNSTGGAVSGFCRFSVELSTDPQKVRALQQAIPGATLPQFDWLQCGATFTYTVDGQSTSLPAQPSGFGSQIVTFSLPLADQKAIAAFVNAFSSTGPGAGTFGVSYDLAANTRLPAVTVVSRFNSTIAYQYQVENRFVTEKRYSTDTWGHSSSHDVSVFVGTFVKEMLQQTQAGTVEVTPGIGLTPTLLDMVTNWAQLQLQKDVEQAVGTAMNLIKNPTNDFSMNSVASFTHTLETSNVVPWYFAVDGTLTPFDATTWQRLYSEVAQQQLQVAFQVQADLATLGIDHINLSFRYGDVPATTHTFAAKDLAWSLALPGQFNGGAFVPGYQYQYVVVYSAPAGGGAAAPSLSTEWISDSATSVMFGAAQLGLMPVTFEAANIDWGDDASQVKQITVDWNWLANNGPVLADSLVLTKDTASQTRTLRSTGPADNQAYRYRLTFLMGDGSKLYANGLSGTAPLQRIDHPLAQVSVGVWLSLPDTAKAVLLRATYDDIVNDIHLSKQWRLAASKATPLDLTAVDDWDFEAVVKNLNATTLVFSGTWIDGQNKQQTIPKTLLRGSNNTLIVSDTEKTVTAVVDASNVAFVAPQNDGVYRVVAMVAKSTGNAAQLANAETLTFDLNEEKIQYVVVGNIDIADTPSFDYQYTYTVNSDKGAHNQQVDAFNTVQRSLGTSLPVVPGMPPAHTPNVAAASSLRSLPLAEASADARTQSLFARHDAFALRCNDSDQALLAQVAALT
jgi:hypothetical protein